MSKKIGAAARRSFQQGGVDCFSDVACTTTDSAGNFALPDLEPGQYAICAESRDGTLVCESPSHVSLTQETRSAQVTLELTGGRIVEGLVSTSDTREKVGGAYVAARSHSRSGYSTVSDDNGWYRLLLPEGTEFVVACHWPEGCVAEGRMQFKTALADLTQSGQEPIRRDFQFLRGGRIRGTITGTDGGVVEGARLELTHTGNGTVLKSSTNKDGGYEIAGCDVSTEYLTKVAAAGYLPFAGRVALEGKNALVNDVTLLITGRDSAVLKGLVRAESGAPLPFARIDLRVHENGRNVVETGSRTAADGSFEFSDLAPGYAILHITDAQGRERSIDRGEEQDDSFVLQLAAGETFDVEVIVADLTGSLKGLVTNSQRVPIAGARVVTEGAGSRIKVETTTDDQGRFGIPELPMYPLRVVVSATGYGTTTLYDVYPSPSDLNVQLPKPTSLTVRVIDARTRETIQGVAVSEANGVGNLRNAETAADGSLLYADVDPGRYLLWTHVSSNPGKYAERRVVLEIPPEQHVEKQIELEPGCIVSATVQYETVPPTPVQGGSAYLYDQQSPDVYYNVELDGDGRFEKSLLPGRYLIQVHCGGVVFPRMNMTVPSQANAAFTFSVPVASARITVNVLRGAYREGAQVFVLLRQGDSLDAPLEEVFDIESLADEEDAGVLQVSELSGGDGELELTNLSPGEYGVTVIQYIYRTKEVLWQSTQRCKVSEGQSLELEMQSP